MPCWKIARTAIASSPRWSSASRTFDESGMSFYSEAATLRGAGTAQSGDIQPATGVSNFDQPCATMPAPGTSVTCIKKSFLSQLVRSMYVESIIVHPFALKLSLRIFE
jgi:hypothetical protein